MSKFHVMLLAGVAMVGVASTAQAADLIINEPAYAPIAEVAAGNWDGPYIGVFLGGGVGTADHNNDDLASSPVCPIAGCDLDLSGALLGVEAGVNMSVGRGLILGLAGDIAWSNLSGDGSWEEDFDLDTSNSINWQGSLRGVIGLDAGTFMPYVTAGVAFANANHWSDWDGEEDDVTHTGWTAGVGVAVAVADNMKLNLEYRHSEYGDKVYDLGAGAANPQFGLSTDQVTVGLRWSL